ncbi:MAG: ABC transporter permease [Oscillospiraceae bacterium]|nr:ABC transporter permease [Oscillospiraceae bacterium]
MKNRKIKTHEPLFHISKRTDVSRSKGIIIRIIAILAALIVCGIVTKIFTGDDPVSIFKTIYLGAFGTGRTLVTIHEIAILLCVSLAVTPAFRMRFWNTGAEGQVLIGCLSTAMCMFYLGGKVPDGLLILIMTIFAIVSGIVWAVIPAFFKAHWGTNETLFTLMMNYVAIQLVEFFLKVADKSGSNVVGPDLLTHGWFPKLFGTNYLLNIFIVAVLTAVLYIYLNYSKHGYEISVVGESENTARYIGINVKKVIVRTMAVSGAICGIAGLLLVGGSSHSIDSNLVGGRGFTAIMVSWLAKFNPVTMVLTSLLIVFLERGADEVSSKFGLNADFAEILTGIILFFIIGCEFFINYKINFNRNKKHVKEDK